MEIIIIVILILCMVIILPWMIKKDFEKRMLAGLRREMTRNIELLGEYNRGIQNSQRTTQGSNQAGENIPPLILKDEVFRKIQRMDFCSKGLRDEDKDLLERVFATSSHKVMHASVGDDQKLCAENMRILSDVLSRLTAYIKD